MQTKLRAAFAALLLLTLAAAPAAFATPEEKQVNLPTGVKLRYVVDGPKDAPVVLFLHGITDSSHSWSAVTPYFTDSYRTYVPDQRGHGDSERPFYGYSMAGFAEDAVAFLDALGIEQAVVVGHSMGSFIAHQLASAHPERVTRLVLVASAPTSVGNEVIEYIWDEIVGLPDFQDPIDPDFIRDFQTGPNPVEADFFEKVLEETGKVPARVWKAAFRGLMTDDHTKFLADVTAPTLILWGTQDAIFSADDQTALRAALPGATFIAYEGAGHNTQWEQPQQVAEDILDFIE